MAETSLAKLLTSGAKGLSAELVRLLPRAWRHRKAEREPYDFEDDQLVTATKAAMLLSQPLVLAGEPGVGKTTFARALSQRLGLPFWQPISVKSTTSGLDLFYSFNEVARFRDAAANSTDKGLRDYVTLSSLGRAIVLSAGEDCPVTLGDEDMQALFGAGAGESRGTLRLVDLFPGVFQDQPAGVRRSVVLIDELDKAPRDAPNDVLAEIETLSFRIRELDLTIGADPDHFPVVLITSNSERSFPDAFLRRSVFHWIETPSGARLKRIVAARAAAPGVLSPEDELVKTAVDYYEWLRGEVENKKPSTAELISFVAALVAEGVKPTETISAAHPKAQRLTGVLLKTRIDLNAVDPQG